MKKSDKITGEPAYRTTIAYAINGQNTVSFDYDEGNETYTRFNDQQQTVELDSEEPVQVSNVFIIATRHEIIDDEGRRSVDIESVGDAYMLTIVNSCKDGFVESDG